MQRFGFLGHLIVCCLPMACNSGSADSGPVPAATAAGAVDADAVSRPDSVTAVESTDDDTVSSAVMTWDEAQALIAGRKGRIVVVDVWSTDCVPCLREFPHFVALQKEFGEEIACISVNIDFLGLEEEPSAELQADVLQFLRKHQAETENVICSDPADEIYERVDFVSIPAVYVYDRSGALKNLFKNDAGDYGKAGFTYENHIAPLVRELAADSAAAE